MLRIYKATANICRNSQPGQGGAADGPRDLRAELLAAEAAHFAKLKGVTDEVPAEPVPKLKRDLEEDTEANLDAEDIEAKRRRILEETRDIDADSIGSDSDSSEEERYLHNLHVSLDSVFNLT